MQKKSTFRSRMENRLAKPENLFTMEHCKKRNVKIVMLSSLVVLLIIGRLFYLQIIRGNVLAKEAMEQIMGEYTEISPRGSIVDRNGEELAVSIVSKSLYVDPEGMDDIAEYWPGSKLPNRNVRDVAAQKLAPILGMKTEELYNIFSEPHRRFTWIKRTMEAEEAQKVAEVIKEEKLNGFHFQEESKRYYTKNKLAAQVLGFVGTDDKGLEGIEASLDSLIKGKESKHGNFFDAKGNRMGQSGLNQVESPKMNTVQLTIDAKMQFILERSLDDAMSKTHCASAAAILMDPNTGEILGMASRPTFDPNMFYKGRSEDFINRAVAIIYEPGSVFKPIMGCAGLMEGVITPTTPFNDLGSIDVGGRRIRNWDGRGLGNVTFTDIIKYSLNTGMAHLGLQLGGKRETEYAKKFGFGSPTGSDVPGEEAGILYNPDDMVPSDVATMGIGQGIAVTPLQMLRAICAIANGGHLLKPYIVDKVVDPSGKVIKAGKKEIVRDVITPEVAGEMRTMMEKVVSEGGGKTAQIKGYKIAGKTGTAEKLAKGGGYTPGLYIASFVGFVPSDNPKYAMLIMLDSPRGAFYGSQVAAPIFRDTLQQILVAKGIQPSDATGLPSVESLLLPKQTGESKLPQMTLLENGKVKLPNLAGYNMRQVAAILQQGKLSLIPRGSGISWKQNPGPGAILKEDDTVEVWFK